MNPPFPNQDGLRNSLRNLLRPIVRLLLRRGYTHPWLIEEIKQAYVEVALRELDDGTRPSDSRVNLMTGIQRPEVKRIRNTDQPKPMNRPHPLAALIALWFGEWSDDEGNTKPLPRVSTDDHKHPTFFQFAERATHRNVAPATFLQDCLDRGLIRHDETNDTLHLIQDAFIPDGNVDEKLLYLGANVGDHLNAAVNNILDETAPHYERSVLYHNFHPDDAAALEKLARKLAMESLQKVNKEARKRAKSGRKGTVRFNFGNYIYTNSEEKKEPQE